MTDETLAVMDPEGVPSLPRAGEPASEDLAFPLVTRPCPRCTAPLDTGDFFCPSCGHDQGEPGSAGEEPAGSMLRCEGCGARMQCSFETRSYRCPFCDSSIVVELPVEPGARERPEYVTPFAVPRKTAEADYRRWLRKGSWFRPGDLAELAGDTTFRGVYLPFWSFSLRAESDWRARIGEYWYRTEIYTVTVTRNGKTTTETRTRQVRETEWWTLAGSYRQFHSGYLISGSHGLPQSQASWLQPYRLEGLKRYQPRFLAGWLSEEYSVEREQALRLALDEFERRQQREVAAFLPGDTHDGLHADTRFLDIQSDLILLPVYVFSYRYRGNVYRFLLNGQTGRHQGEKPLSRARIVLTTLGIAAAVAGLVFLIFLFAR